MWDDTSVVGSKRAESGVQAAGGLFDGFEHYRTPTHEDYKRLLTRGLVAPDTNVFLNL